MKLADGVLVEVLGHSHDLTAPPYLTLCRQPELQEQKQSNFLKSLGAQGCLDLPLAVSHTCPHHKCKLSTCTAG